MTRPRIVLSLALILVVVVIVINLPPEQNDAAPPIKRTLITMGTFVDIEVRDCDPALADLAIDAAFSEVLRINDTYTPFNEASPLWQLNNTESDTVHISPEFHYLMTFCDTVNHLTAGGFDPSVAALINLWKIWGDDPVIPTATEIQIARNQSGWEKILLIGDSLMVRKQGVMLDFGGVAKGYAVDRAVAILAEQGVKRALVNAGGEILTLGDEWIIGIQHPSLPEELVRNIRIANAAVATSGDYEQYHEEKGRRYHHILDPATGYPTTGCRSVTIVAPNCIAADAYATGIFVLGPLAGMELVNRIPGLEAMLIDSSGSILYSSGFESFLQD